MNLKSKDQLRKVGLDLIFVFNNAAFFWGQFSWKIVFNWRNEGELKMEENLIMNILMIKIGRVKKKVNEN